MADRCADCADVCAILFYLLKKKQNLMRSMLTGDKHLGVAAPASADDLRSRTFAAVLLAVCAAVVAWIVGLGA